MFSKLTCYLTKGVFYKVGSKTYLVGERVPAIANVFVCEVYKDGDLGEIEAMYYRQNNNWKITDEIIIKDKYKEKIQELFCYGYSDFIKKKRNDELPYVYDYLECGRINTLKKYAVSQKDKTPNEFINWVKKNCRYSPKNNLAVMVDKITDVIIGFKSDEELYNIYKTSKIK